MLGVEWFCSVGFGLTVVYLKTNYAWTDKVNKSKRMQPNILIDLFECVNWLPKGVVLKGYSICKTEFIKFIVIWPYNQGIVY